MVAARFPPQLGGTETHVSEVAQRIAGRGVDVTVITTDVSGQLPPVEQRGEVVVRRFPARPRSTDLYASPGLAREAGAGRLRPRACTGCAHARTSHGARRRSAGQNPDGGDIPHREAIPVGCAATVRGAQWRALRPLLRRSQALIAVCAYEVELFARRLGVDPRRFGWSGMAPSPSPLMTGSQRHRALHSSARSDVWSAIKATIVLSRPCPPFSSRHRVRTWP